ncbi:MAG: type II secretion system protein GspL [Massilia sp.]
MTTLYIRPAARAEGEGALARFALVADNGSIVQQGEGLLRGMGDVIAASRRVLLLLPAAEVTLLAVKTPPLSPARLRAALPGLVEEQILGDPAECVLVAAPSASADGLRSIAVVQRAWLEVLVKALLALGARAVGAVPAQLCLPLHPGKVSAAVGAAELTIRQAQYQGMGLAMHSVPALALQTARALAGEAPLVLYVAADQLEQYRQLAADAPVTVEAEHWGVWIAGAAGPALDLVPGLGTAGARKRDWQRWRWPLAIALLALAVNLVGINVEWLRLKHEADATRAAMLQTFKSAFPKQTVILDPVAQMRSNLAQARVASGQLGADEFTYLAAALGEAARGLGRPLQIASLDYRERALSVKLKPESVDPALAAQLGAALAPRKLSVTEPAAGTLLIRANGGKS